MLRARIGQVCVTEDGTAATRALDVCSDKDLLTQSGHHPAGLLRQIRQADSTVRFRELCDEIELPSFIKTSGATGLHVLLPLGGQCTHSESRVLGEILARVIEQKHGRIATTARAIGARDGKVYVDYLQNGHGKTIAGPFSARPVPGATCSAPLRWSEVDGKLDPKKFTLKTLPARDLQPVTEDQAAQK